MTLSLLLLPLAVSCLQDPLPAAAARDEAPGAAEHAAAYLDTTRSTAEGRAARAEHLATLDALPPLDAEEAALWRARLLEQAASRETLVAEAGRKFVYGGSPSHVYALAGELEAPKGVLVALHGGGTGGGEKTLGNLKKFQRAAAEQGWVVIGPSREERREDSWWDREPYEARIAELLEAALRTWEIDADHVYVSGFSAGGVGTWTFGGSHADRVAALAPAGGGPIHGSTGLLPSLRNVPMVVQQGARDRRAPPEPVRDALATIDGYRERWGGFDIQYTEDAEGSHSEPDAGMSAWVGQVAHHVREARPETFGWEPSRAWKQQLHNLWWDGALPGPVVWCELDRAGNAVDLTSEGDLTGLGVLLDDALLDLDADVTIRVNGEAVWTGRPARSLGALVRTADTGDPALTFDAMVRVP